ncbi:hypothetical protein MTP03_09380 [Tsukamurella sp. PLM1]|nr:hypothetical protein MTP03_09380 [Tsukamurella sp. PLM1]
MLSSAPRQLVAGLRMLIVMTVVLGVAFPLVIWGVGQVAFASKANGSQIERSGTVVGSELLAQKFDGPQWFHPRPSAGDYDTLASGGTNLGPNSTELIALIAECRAAVAGQEGVAPSDVPTDAVTASFSGLDPHISPRTPGCRPPAWRRPAASRRSGWPRSSPRTPTGGSWGTWARSGLTW